MVALRGLSAVCTQICENGASCVASDTCQCLAGWQGIDCTTPVCSSACGINKVCTSPNTCTCKPGWGQSDCSQALCVQTCHNGGSCTAPDTCTCRDGWFDTNCTTPVCSQTCGNGGNCTANNHCSCPEKWTGADCRTPTCLQTCHNGGACRLSLCHSCLCVCVTLLLLVCTGLVWSCLDWTTGSCVAPDTCICPPQWANYDCGVPVCNQGFFKPNPSNYPNHYLASNILLKETFRVCNLVTWCYATKEFECLQQLSMTMTAIELPSGEGKARDRFKYG